MLSTEVREKLFQQYLLEQVRLRFPLFSENTQFFINANSLGLSQQKNAEKIETAASVVEELQKSSSPPNPAMFQKLRVLLSSRPQRTYLIS